MKLSIGIMVKNEEKNLERCLQSLQPLRDAVDSELIIVDTGSEDSTVEIAKRFTDKVYFHRWNNDFSEVRNITISYATGEWFFVIDADEVLEESQWIVQFLTSVASKKYNAATIGVKNITVANNPNAFSTLVSLRLFRKTKVFHYRGVVHNQPVFEGKVAALKARLLHYGYLSTDTELMERKFQRTSSILKSELEKDPENIYYLYQLAVSYGMHKDYAEAIYYSEKAYSLFLEIPDQANFMYVVTYMAMMYQATQNYSKLEDVCLKALEVEEGYIDIYYCLAEAQAVKGQYKEAIENYHKYLELLSDHESMTVGSTAVIDYTLGNREYAYMNLVGLYRLVENCQKSLEYIEKITNKSLIKDKLHYILLVYIELGKFSELRDYYDLVVEESWQGLFYEKLEEVKKNYDHGVAVDIAAVFVDIPHEYGLLSKLIYEDATEIYSEEALTTVGKINVATLPMYCSSILYYLLKRRYPIEKLFVDFKEIWLTVLFDQIVKKHSDLGRIIYKFLDTYHIDTAIYGYKLSKALCRYALLLDKLTEREYRTIFERYIQHGILYLQMVYNPTVLENQMVYEVKNDEEVFLLYMYQASYQKSHNEANYLKYLREALTALPVMKKGIEFLLHDQQESEQNASDEFEAYKIQIKTTIKNLIKVNNCFEAQSIINEYKSIVPNDMEIILLESEIALRQTDTKSLVN